ncbi:MAG: DNA repair protein RecO [Actinomycetota bacterium]|jgi:DNA repair protein RecO (recombination protein O)|nr:DNA repair protein RecO [Actinomycetota bacterium]
MSLYRDRGVVLRSYKLGEADRIVVLLTPEHGKVRAVAKGVRRPKSKIGGRLEPLSHVELLLWGGKELDIVRQAELAEPWHFLRRDLVHLSRGMAMAEAAEQVAQEGEPAEALYVMLVKALRTLDERPGPLVVASFYWKLLALDGAGPVLGSCANCGASPPAVSLVAFDIAQGGALCRACRRGEPLSPAAHELVSWILGGSLARALEVPASSTTAEVAHLATVSLEAHLEKHLRTARALEPA